MVVVPTVTVDVCHSKVLPEVHKNSPAHQSARLDLDLELNNAWVGKSEKSYTAMCRRSDIAVHQCLLWSKRWGFLYWSSPLPTLQGLLQDLRGDPPRVAVYRPGSAPRHHVNQVSVRQLQTDHGGHTQTGPSVCTPTGCILCFFLILD